MTDASWEKTRSLSTLKSFLRRSVKRNVSKRTLGTQTALFRFDFLFSQHAAGRISQCRWQQTHHWNVKREEKPSSLTHPIWHRSSSRYENKKRFTGKRSGGIFHTQIHKKKNRTGRTTLPFFSVPTFPFPSGWTCVIERSVCGR